MILNLKKSLGKQELIDTLWNVNHELYSALMARARINRYIMECKSLYTHNTYYDYF